MRQERDRPFALAFILVLVLGCALAAAGAAPQAVGGAAGPEALGFKKHFIIEIINPSPMPLENHAVIIDVADLRATVAPDFNTYMYALFDVAGGEYGLVVSQADDLDEDRYHDEIVLVRTLPPSSTTRLACYYTPERSFQLMPPQKAFARGAWGAGDAEAGWESNLAAFRISHGRIGFFGKLQPGLVLKKFPLADPKDRAWGMDVLPPDETAGLGGLSVWDGASRRPLYGASAVQARLSVVSPGPIRGLVKAEYPAVKTAGGEAALTVYFSAFADNDYSRQDVVVAVKSGMPGKPVLLGPALRKLDGETWSLDKSKGALAVWGRGADKAGEIGLAAIFAPADLAGTDDAGPDHALKLAAGAGRRLTYWVAGAWERGITAPAESPAAKAWARRAGDLAARLLVPVRVEFKAK